jgi:hypothetical protein
VSQPRYTAQSHDATKADRMVFVDAAQSLVGLNSVQDVLFTTPVDVPSDQRCGKVVFSDMPVTGTPFPGGCNTGDLTPQEKALAFIFFDIATCVGVLE